MARPTVAIATSRVQADARQLSNHEDTQGRDKALGGIMDGYESQIRGAVANGGADAAGFSSGAAVT